MEQMYVPFSRRGDRPELTFLLPETACDGHCRLNGIPVTPNKECIFRSKYLKQKAGGNLLPLHPPDSPSENFRYALFHARRVPERYGRKNVEYSAKTWKYGFLRPFS